LVAAEWTFRAAKHEALLDYIRTAPSLAAVVRSDNHGDGGVVVHGVDAELRRHWGNAVDVAVRYWLPFDKYRRLAAAQQSLAACRRELARFQVQR
jgi:hypothetical protein